MFKLTNITKTYSDNNFSINALKDVNVEFNNHGFYFILGPSGSGKSTLLNILGGLDTPTSGEMSIANVNTKNFTEKQWDEYRNHHLGFVFQSFNLLSHLTILENVELKLKNVNKYSAKEIKDKSISMLDKVGLIDHIYKKPTQLSGGQQQRVAIARALVSGPKVLLCDEPTGALDNNTSREVMELLQEISEDTLIITVTHDIKLANTYKSIILEVKKGRIDDIVLDNNDKLMLPKNTYQISNYNSLKLSLKNLTTSIRRTLIVILTCALAITTVFTLFSINRGLNYELIEQGIDKLSLHPISIYSRSVISDEQVEQLTNIDESLYNIQTYSSLSMLRTIDKNYVQESNHINILPNNDSDLLEQYNLLSGSLDLDNDEIVLVLDKYNQLGNAASYLSYLGDGLQAEEYIGAEIRRVPLDISFEWNGTLMDEVDGEEVYNNSEVLKIGAVLSPKDLYPANDYIGVNNILRNGIYVTHSKHEEIITESANSDFAMYHYENVGLNIINGEVMTDGQIFLSQYTRSFVKGYYSIAFVPSSYESKQKLLEEINNIIDDSVRLYDPSAETIEYTQSSIDILLLVISVISILAIFIAATLIFILTYANILQRKKEVGIYRGLGFTKNKTISIFVQETLIISAIASFIAIALHLIIIIPINSFSNEYFGYNNVAIFVPLNIVVLSLICTTTFIISSYLPVRRGVNVNIADIVR